MMRPLLLALISLAISFQAFAGPGGDDAVKFDKLYNRTQMLSARCVSQDSAGMIWFGTDKCLYSYDGSELRQHVSEIGHTQINSIIIRNGTIALGCNEGLLFYDIGTGTFRQDEYFVNDQVRALASSNETLFVGASSGAYEVKWEGVDKSTSAIRLSDEQIFALEFAGDRLWIGSTKGLGLVRKEDRRFQSVPLVMDGSSVSATVVTDICAADDSTLWVGTATDILKMDSRTLQVTKRFSAPVIKSICPARNGGLFYGTDNGLFFIGKEAVQNTKEREGVFWKNHLDRDGNIWFATDNGLLLARQKFLVNAIDIGSLPENTNFYCLLKDSKGRLWVGGSNGLLLYERKGNKPYSLQRHYSMDNSEFFIPHNKIRKIVEDKHDGSIHLTTDGGYLSLNESTLKFESLEIPDSYNWFYDLIIDGNKIWMASFDGLLCLYKGKVVSRYNLSSGLSSNDVCQIAKDRSGNIWILTRDQNLFVLEIARDKIHRIDFSHLTGEKHPEHIISDLDGSLWVSVKNKLIHLNSFGQEEKAEVFILDSEEGAESYSLYDAIGKIWICSSQGIFVLDKNTGSIDRFCLNSSYQALCYDPLEKNIILCSLGTVSFFSINDFDKLSGNEDRDLTVTSVRINGTDFVPSSDLASGSFKLRHNQNNLTISFSDYNYSSEITYKYQYKLAERNATWNDVISGNTISLDAMKPGKYKLYISSRMNDDTDDAILSFTIRKPWYFSNLIILAYAMMLGLIIYIIIRSLMLKKYLELEREQRAVLLSESKQKENFFGNIAHEFKTPLSLIIAPLGKLLQTTERKEDVQMLKIAYDNANKLNSLVHNTIDYYKKTNNTSDDLIKSEVEFVEFAKGIFFSYKDLYPKNEFIFDSGQKEIMIEVDVVKMEAILNNLMSNACKYTPEGGSIIMVLERDFIGNRLIIKISDTGVGIPEAELPLIFQRYFESSRTKNGNYDSTGVGLSIIKKYVELHGGRVSVDSDDNGTTFTVTIPCQAVYDSASRPAGAEDTDESDKPLIVIVDDNVQICNFLENVLRDKYRCISSNNGKSGLKLCKDVAPDLIIADVMMPVMDGLEMCRLIREHQPLSTIPIILLTAKGDRETEKKSIDLNIDSFITKPFDYSTLIAKIDQLIGNKKRMEQKLRLEMIQEPKESHELSYDEKFLQKVTDIIEEHIDDSELSVQSLCKIGDFNEKQLYRKVKKLTGLSTIEYVRSIRLKKAAILLQNGSFTISEVMYSVGFSNASYFSRAFMAEFGKTPTEYLKSHKQT